MLTQMDLRVLRMRADTAGGPFVVTAFSTPGLGLFVSDVSRITGFTKISLAMCIFVSEGTVDPSKYPVTNILDTAVIS